MAECSGFNIAVNGLVRPCMVGDRKALFHRWFDEYRVLEPAITIGGHPGGQVSTLLGLVEWEDGTMHVFHPHQIRMLDTDEQMGGFDGYYNHESAQASYLPDNLKPVYEDLLNELRRGKINEKEG